MFSFNILSILSSNTFQRIISIELIIITKQKITFLNSRFLKEKEK